jgi:hypothetical protein
MVVFNIHSRHDSSYAQLMSFLCEYKRPKRKICCHSMKACGGTAPSFFTSALKVNEWSVSRSLRFTPEDTSFVTDGIRAWMRSRNGLDSVEKKISCPCRESNPGFLVRHFTHWAMLAAHMYILYYLWQCMENYQLPFCLGQTGLEQRLTFYVL